MSDTFDRTGANAGARKFIYQIFYNEASRRVLDGGFIPLDNTADERPDWFELWVIRNFLRNHRLEDHAWYGFLSPRFQEKTQYASDYLFGVLDNLDATTDVALFSQGANILCYFQNPYEQGEHCHPGLLEGSQRFLDHIGFGIDLRILVTHWGNSAFSNYVIAKPRYWAQWLSIAESFFDYVENGPGRDLALDTDYDGRRAPMKTFIQERFPALLLAGGSYKIFAPDLPARLAHLDARTRETLLACDFLKRRYLLAGDRSDILRFRQLRAAVPVQ